MRWEYNEILSDHEYETTRDETRKEYEDKEELFPNYKINFISHYLGEFKWFFQPLFQESIPRQCSTEDKQNNQDYILCCCVCVFCFTNERDEDI